MSTDLTNDFEAFPEIVRSMQCQDSVESVEALKGERNDYVLEPKYDGFRLVAQVGIGEVRLYTREGKRQDGKLPHIAEELLRHWPPGTVLDGEVTAMTADYPDGELKMNFDYVQSVMLSLPERAVQVQEENRPLTYSVFDIMQLGDEDLRDETLLTRKGHLKEHHLVLDWVHCSLAPTFPCEAYVHQACLDKGFEGTVAKRKDSTYVWRNGKGWFKLKPQKLIDAVVLGFTDGEGKYAGQIGAMVFGQPVPDDIDLTKVNCEVRGDYIVRGQCSGMTDELRLDMSERREELVGHVVEIKHHGLMHGGVKFRHPQFSRWRPDKPVADVRWHDR